MTAVDDLITNIQAFRASADSSPLVCDSDLMIAALQQLAAGGGAIAATQADEEAATSTIVFTNPGVQQFHPSAAKAWCIVTVSGGVPTLGQSYNISGIIDIGTGDLSMNFITSFSSIDWTSIAWAERVSDNGAVANSRNVYRSAIGDSSGLVILLCFDNTAVTNALKDPQEWFFAGFGDQ